MWLLIVIQWLHVFLGIVWFGGTMYLDFVALPAVTTLPLDQQRNISRPLTIFTDRALVPASILVIILGLIRGIVFGPVRSLDFLLGAAYGITFLIAFLASVATFLWGRFVVARAAGHLETFPLAAVMKSGSTAAHAFAAQVQRVKLLAIVQLSGFFIIFTCMVFMRFGL